MCLITVIFNFSSDFAIYHHHHHHRDSNDYDHWTQTAIDLRAGENKEELSSMGEVCNTKM